MLPRGLGGAAPSAARTLARTLGRTAPAARTLAPTLGRAIRHSTTSAPIYQLDAFTDQPFGGNPAAVVPLASGWLPDATLLAIAAENALSETAFTVPGEEDGVYHLRWFTPTLEVDMCGHATLATASLILGKLEPERPEVAFDTRSGRLIVRRADAAGADATAAAGALPRLTLDFPTWPVGDAVAPPASLVASLNGTRDPTVAHAIEPLHGAPYYLFLYADESDVRALAPTMSAMEANVVATAPAASDGVDFVSRWFGPMSGIPEDPVTGSAHMTLAPFWAERLGKQQMEARQLSARGGALHVALTADDRVLISGRAAFYMEGTISLPAE